MERRMRAWVELRSACFELRRATLRSQHPRWSDARVAREIQRDLDRAWSAKLDAYRKNG